MHKQYLLLAWEIIKLFGLLVILYKLLTSLIMAITKVTNNNRCKQIYATHC